MLYIPLERLNYMDYRGFSEGNCKIIDQKLEMAIAIKKKAIHG
jgi:hypothetical protein